MLFFSRNVPLLWSHISHQLKRSNIKCQKAQFIRDFSRVRKTLVNTQVKSPVNEQEIKKEESDDGIASLLNDAASFNQGNPPGEEWTTPVYPGCENRMQSRHAVRPKVDPRGTSVILFPGQGVQHIGMGNSLLDYPNVNEMFEAASEILRFNLLDLCLNGPEDMLNDTANCQAAVMVTSLAAVEKLRAESPQVIENCIATAGFSVGEYAALVFAGALNFEDAVRLLQIRGQVMQQASNLQPSGMMTVMLRPDAKVKYMCAAAKEWCTRQNVDNPECCIAIYLFPECKVIAGNFEALRFLELNAQDFGIRKMKNLNVSGAFHSSLMKPAKEVLDKALKTVPFKMPLISVHANVDAKPYVNVKQIVKKLSDQLCNPVKWEQTMHVIFERPQDTAFPSVYECGPGNSLKSVLRMNNAKAYTCYNNVTVME